MLVPLKEKKKLVKDVHKVQFKVRTVDEPEPDCYLLEPMVRSKVHYLGRTKPGVQFSVLLFQPSVGVDGSLTRSDEKVSQKHQKH
jgi:hypothetical protein